MTFNAMGADSQGLDATSPAIVLDRVSKSYAKKKAIDNLNLTIEKGELFGFIGPDGAGKTTLFHMLAGVLDASDGIITILDKSARDNRLNIGYLTQHFSLYPDLSVNENLKYFAATRSISRESFLERRTKLLHLVGLDQFGDRLAANLSGGMKQKLALCCALIFSPRVLLLDEPTTGLDPISRREFWQLLSQVAHSGVTTVIATPNFAEAELCDRVALLNHGHVLQLGRPDDLRSKLEMNRLELRSDNLRQVFEVIRDAVGKELGDQICDVNTYGDRIDVLAKSKSNVRAILARNFEDKNLSAHCSVEEPTLENVYLMSVVSTLDQHKVRMVSGIQKEDSGPPRQNIAIEAKGLYKRFGNFTSVRDVHLAIKYGEVYGLLGANGAGKTTTIKMLCGLTEPSAGSLTIGGANGEYRGRELRRRIGYMSQKFTLYEDLSILENLKFYASAYSIPVQQRTSKINWVLHICGITETDNSPVKSLPQGLKQRIAFGAAVMHDPEILFLDEPTSGLDPIARRQLWDVIAELARAGTAILVTTHFLDDAEYCNRLGLMVNGSLIAEGSPDQIKSHSEKLFEIVVDDTVKAYSILSKNFDASLISVFPKRLHIQLDDTTSGEQVFELLRAGKVHPSRSCGVPPSLEDAFVQLVRKERS